MSSITQFTGRATAVVKEFSPEIMAFAGVGLTVTGAVLAAKATLKLEQKVALFEARKEALDTQRGSELLDDKEYKKELRKAYVSFITDLTKLYGIPVALGTAGIGMMLGAQGVLKKRNIAAIGAYKALEETYNEYRDRVIGEVGEEREERIRLGLRALEEDGTSTEPDADDKPMALLDDEERARVLTGASQYAVLFSPETSKNYSPNPDYNLTTLTVAQAMLTDKLIARGYLFLNDVLEHLGMAKTEAGQYVGWIFKSEQDIANGVKGDNHVDFFLDRGINISRDHFLRDGQGNILLDFNVDGVIIDKVWRRKK